MKMVSDHTWVDQKIGAIRSAIKAQIVTVVDAAVTSSFGKVRSCTPISSWYAAHAA